MRSRPLLAAAAAAGLLAAGCDYWRNLVDEKTVATAHLKVKVIDAYTDEPLLAVCTDSNRGLELKTNTRDGLAELPHAGTGAYTFLCKTPWGYYDRIDGFPLTPPGKTVIFRMARLGGEAEWYKGDTLREVRIREKFDTLRFPIDFAFHAYPKENSADTTKKSFQYEWTFAKAKNLDITTNEGLSKFPVFRARAEPVDVTPGPDTLTLRVWSLMQIESIPYPIGEFKRPFVWVRNQLPKLTIDSSIAARQFPVGCPEIYQPLWVSFSIEDPDLDCKSIRFYTEDTTSSFGAVDTTLSCLESLIKFDLKNTFKTLRSDTAFLRPNILKTTVTDDNGERIDSTIRIVTRSNMLPTLVSRIENPLNSVFTDDPVKIYFEASDGDGIPKLAIISWDGVNGETRMDYSQSQRDGHTLRDSAIWSYRTPGWKYFNVGISDVCNATVYKSDSILIRDNRAPEVELKYLRDEGTAQDHLHVFQITVRDQDIMENLEDRITEVYVDWGGEGSRLEDSPNIASFYAKTFKHHFTKPPDSLGRYRIIIDAHDAHNGVGKDTLFLIP